MKVKGVTLAFGIALSSSYFAWLIVDLFLENRSYTSYENFYIHAAVSFLMVLAGLFLKHKVIRWGIIFGGVLVLFFSTLLYTWDILVHIL